MLTRRHIRVKVMQSIYALHQTENHNLQKEEKFLLSSMDNMYLLYVALMSLWTELLKRGETLQQISKAKYLATDKDKQLNQKLISNKVLLYIVNNQSLTDLIDKQNPINWKLYSEYVDLLYNQIIQSEEYQYYMQNSQNSFEIDKNFLIDLYKKIIAVDEKLYDFLQEGAMTWLDDFPLVNTLIIKLLKGIKQDNPPLYFVPKLFKDVVDQEFAIDLLRKAVLNDEKYNKYLKGKTPQWEITRLAEIDVILIKMAITEFLKFPSIPVKVTINEYVEIAKEYSTPKSSIFINGILDKLSKEFSENGLLQKIGRGLL